MLQEDLWHRTKNEEVRNRVWAAIGPHDDLSIVSTRKLRWYGHVTRSTGLTKTIMQGTVPGGRRRGRPKKRWNDNIKEWTELPLAKALRLAEDKDGWRKIVKTSVVPLQPPPPPHTHTHTHPPPPPPNPQRVRGEEEEDDDDDDDDEEEEEEEEEEFEKKWYQQLSHT